MQLTRIALVLGLGPEVSDAPALFVGVEAKVQTNGVIDAADETHAGVGYGNYTEERQQLFAGMTLDDIVSEIKRGKGRTESRR